jgi:outer membrane protein OmpA-like peptidoglycan-associated protein
MYQIRIITASVATLMLLFLASTASAQFLKNLKSQVKETVKQTVEQRTMEKASSATNTAIDKTSSAVGTEAKKVLTGHKEDVDEEPAVSVENAEVASVSPEASPAPAAVVANYRSYDFVPGDKIIFQPDLSGESDAELPARFVIRKGNAEIQTYEGEKFLHLDAGGYTTVMPLMDAESYLPEQFTVEFDMMYENPRTDYFSSVNDFSVYFYTADDENYDGYGLSMFKIRSNSQTLLGGTGAGAVNVSDEVKKALNTNNTWHHIAVYVRRNIAKAYIGSSRVQATNNFPTGAAKLAIRTDGNYGFKIKNFRLAAGGDDKYNKIVTDGKFITHGIQFDVAQATLKPESMGAINEVAKLMKDHGDLNFEIRGHTDSDGDEDANMELSQQRADAVKAELMEAGIEESRLTTKGFGESQPLNSNDTAEGKANNRRVEFVKR